MEVLAAGNRIIHGTYIHHSTFKRVVNFVHHDQSDLPLLSFGDQSTFFAVNHLNLNQQAFAWIKRQGQLSISTQIMGDDKTQLSLPVTRFNGQIPSSAQSLGRERWIKQFANLETWCLKFSSIHDASILKVIYHPTATNGLGAFAQALVARFQLLLNSEQTTEASLLALAGFKGLGVGLTPSGDDFIQGSLAALHLLEIEEQKDLSFIRKKIAVSGHGTNRYSQTFLQQAFDKNYNSLVQCFLTKFIQGEEFLNELHVLFEYGETSGADWLAGFIWTIKRRSIW